MNYNAHCITLQIYIATKFLVPCDFSAICDVILSSIDITYKYSTDVLKINIK